MKLQRHAVQAKGSGQYWRMLRPDPRPVTNHLNADVANDEAGLGNQPERLTQQRLAGGTRPLGPVRAELCAEIPQPGG